MTKPTINIRQATIDDTEKITQFRIDQYKTAKEFEILDLDALSEQRGKIYLAELDDRIISTMQQEIISSVMTATILTHTIIPTNFSHFDTMYLSKAGTQKEYRNTGLNSYLRLLSIKEALTTNTINSLIGIAYENAPRLHILEKLGYIFTEVQLLDKEYTNPYGKVFFLSLNRPQFQLAIDILETETSDLTQKFEIKLQ